MKLVLLSHCILNQSIRAVGVKNKTGEGVLNEVLNELNRSDISLFQMPCTEYLWEGLERRAAGRQKYDNAQYREICKKTAREVA